MRKIYSLILAIVLISSQSCKKELDFDYNDVDPIPVIEGILTQDGLEVRISQSRSMSDNQKGTCITNALVRLSSTAGESEIVPYSDGAYRSCTKGVVGHTYTLEVELDGKKFTTSSTMKHGVEIQDVSWPWVSLGGNPMQMISFEFDEVPNEENYYTYYMYKNGELYGWAVFSDVPYRNIRATVSGFCYYDGEVEHDEESIIYDGDEIELVIRSFDRQTYDYMYALGLGTYTPKSPFQGGVCLGYFSAVSENRHKEIYHYIKP